MLTIKDVRNILEKVLRKHYDFVDYGINPTKVTDRTKEFRIEFRIYDAEFWMDIDPEIASIRICTRAFGDVDHMDSLQIWFSKPYQYDTEKFEFGWRHDIKEFFDAFQAHLQEKYESDKVAVIGKAIIGESIIGEEKPSIFNNLKDDEEDEDEYI